jgi:3-oxoadipate enol-lactonase
MTLILGSSLGTTRAIFDDSAPGLEARMRLIRYDHRGSAGQPTPPGDWEIADFGRDVLALMDRSGIERASIGGVSLGGMAALWLAAHAPERVERIVAACTTAHFGDPDFWRERARIVRTAGSTEVIADAVVERWLTPGFAAAHPDVHERLRAMLVATPAEGYAAACEAIARMDMREDIRRITAPTLVIGAADDPATPLDHQRAIADAVPAARLEVIVDAAHLANVQQPEAFNRLVIDHLEAP